MTQCHNWPVMRRVKVGVTGHYLATLKYSKGYYWFFWAIDAISSYSICIGAFRAISREIIVVYNAYCFITLNSEIDRMSTVSVPLILIGESSQRAIIFMIELLRGQALSPVFMNSDIIAGLVNEHMTTVSVVIQNLDEKNTLLVFTESEDTKKYAINCYPLRCGWVTV